MTATLGVLLLLPALAGGALCLTGRRADRAANLSPRRAGTRRAGRAANLVPYRGESRRAACGFRRIPRRWRRDAA